MDISTLTLPDHVEYKKSRVKQYFKEQRALRTETTINDTRDFQINKGVKISLAILSSVNEVAGITNVRTSHLSAMYRLP